MDHHTLHFILRVLSVVAVITTVWILFQQWLKHRERQWAFTLKQDNNKALAPLKITAYERLVVMLERISPQSLVLRSLPGHVTAGTLQLELVRAIREEFEHNVSLQMYVSNECWEIIRKAKDETAELIRIAFTRVRPDSPAMDLVREIMELENRSGFNATRIALQAIRTEMAGYF
jgi:hypothetical protein